MRTALILMTKTLNFWFTRHVLPENQGTNDIAIILIHRRQINIYYKEDGTKLMSWNKMHLDNFDSSKARAERRFEEVVATQGYEYLKKIPIESRQLEDLRF